MTAEVQEGPKVSETQKFIHIKPRPGAKVVGNQHWSGTLKGASGKEYKFKGANRLSIPGTGVLLDLSQKRDMMYYDIFTGPSCKARFNKNAGTMYRFDMVDTEKDAMEYLANEDKRTDYKAAVKAMKPHELRIMGLFFKIKGSSDVIRGGIYRLIDDDKTRATVGKFILHPERMLLEYIYLGLEKGDKANSKGIYKNDSGLFMYNTTPLGISEDAVIAYLRGESEEAVAIREILKRDYQEASKVK